ncbi:acyl-CoA dehydrogenase [Cryobacterium sp. Sr8]|uniref:Acyl-CoA dehydrogenase n=1 Tax=Cryobacterium psychrotolerans TaxID=386301 RepID=A0A1G8Y6Y9_9MICO|nr:MULTISPECIES: acyl-CoA dehydrogenase family protein [Cryobacterium]TFD49344.1 acyl-CoA dehydrogenase [Cryobacterium sp. TMT1-2-1]TFD81964.1 acyl-CoA dehydrogenase [Cryobacterium sp. Sr8]TFD90887.1 acyl-CoA dehydrogenase [Cryobacterium psychrotolerans]SDJ98608.1 Acyl-CoA dehydrogenase [Cryobacterium psychrotolerans]
MDFSLSDEHADLKAAVASIVKPYGGAYYAEHSKNREPCDEVWQALGEAGLIGVNIPEAFGGGGAGMLELALVAEESAAQGVPLLLILVSAAISAEVITEFGTDDQRQAWLPGLADGTSKMAFAITEPDAGSNTHLISTTARRDGDDWVLSGSKYYISGVDESDAVLVVARTGRKDDGKPLMSLFIVPVGTPGLDKTRIEMDVMLPEKQYTLFFDDVRVGADALVGEEGKGFEQVFHGLNPERITGAALCIGIARFALTQASKYASEREVWGAPLGTHQGLAHPLAKASMETELAALMMRKAAWLHDQGLPAGEASNTAKYAAAEAALAAIDAAIQTMGGNGLAQEYGLLPYWGLARLLRIAPVSREMILNYIAQHSLGLPKSY